MKILYVCKSLPYSFQGGIQTHVWKLSGCMVKLGHEVTILTGGSMIKGEQRLQMEGRQIIELPYFPGRRLPAFSTTAEEWSFNRSASKWLIKNQIDYDVIHLQGRSGGLFLKNKKEVKVPVVNTLHGLIEMEQKFATKKGGNIDAQLHRKFATNLENYGLKNADALIAVSEQMIRDFTSRLPEAHQKTTKISNGIDEVTTVDKVCSDPNLLLFVGRLTALKGVFELVEAMRLIPEPVQLVMVGDGDARTALDQRIKELGLEKRILLTGGLNSDKVGKWMERCQALILPSFHETQGLVLLEANSFGKPVIANAVGGMTEVVQHGKNGVLMLGNDPSTIAKAVDYLFERPMLANLMGMQGKLMVQENYTWHNIAKETIRFYQSVMMQFQHSSENSFSKMQTQYSI